MITNAIQAGAALLTYSNLVVQLLTGQVGDVARALELRQNVPFDAAHMEFQIDGKPTVVSATVRTEDFEFLFLHGQLFRVGWRDEFRADSWDRLVAPHLTNSAQALSASDAEGRAFQLLSHLHADTNKLAQLYKSTVTVDQIELHRPQVYSNDKIQISVSFKPKTFGRYDSREIRMRLLATTGEVIYFEILDYDGSMWKELFDSPPLRISNASDLSPPLIVRASAKVDTFQTGDVNAIPGLLKQAVEQLRSLLGTNRPKLYVVRDNLNAPRVVAETLKTMLADAPMVGTAERWRDDLPLPDALLDKFKKGYRGIEIHALCGEAKVSTKLVTLPEVTPPIVPHGHISNDYKFLELVRKLKGPATELMEDMRPPTNEITWPFEVDTGGAQYYAFGHAFSQLVSKKPGFVDVESFGVNSNVYWNGSVITNGYISVAISGALPFSRYDWGTQQADYEIAKRLVDCPDVGPHPMEFVTTLFGEQAVKLLQSCKHIEAFRIGSGMPAVSKIADDHPSPAITNILRGYQVIAPGKVYGADLGRRIFDGFINAEYPHESWVNNCMFDPGVAFVCWIGKERVEVLLCFHCDDVSVTSFDAAGRDRGHAYFPYGRIAPKW